MKKIILLTTLIFFTLNGNTSNKTSQTYVDSTKLFVRVSKLDNQIKSKLSDYGKVIDFKKEFVVPQHNNYQNTIDISWVILKEVPINSFSKIQSLDEVTYMSFFIQNESKKSYGVTGLLYAKMKNFNEKIIQNLEQEYKFNVVDIIGYEKKTLKILLNKKTKMEVQKLKEALNNSLLFEYVDDALLYNFELNCTGNSFFSNQWGHKNIGQSSGIYGTDISFCGAKDITLGNSNIVVAVVDDGVELNHPDLNNNVILGYNAVNNSVGGSPANNQSPHGTNCAGIIAAENNTIGVVGVAPNCKILPCRNDFDYSQTTEWLANSIDFAWQKGVDVISNSWGGGSNSSIIDNAIKNALNFGRNGLGCVVVFATGNDDGGVGYPARSSARILAVGAIDRCGVRSGRIDRVPNSCDPWCSNCRPASQYGKELDVVAPGTSVYTTDISGSGGYVSGDYNPNFGGTSAACPYVAGVAALLLSINPCLTEKEVSYHIEKSAKTIRTDLYNYAFVDYPNSNEWDRLLKDWNQEVGYGLVNAESALLSVIYETFIKEMENEFISNNLSIYQMGTLKVGYDVNPYTQNGNYTVGSNSNVEFVATEKIILEHGFTASAGSVFSARIENFDGDCVVWSKQKEWEPSFAIEDELIEKIDSNDFNYLVKKAPLFFPNPFTNDLFVQYDLDDDSEVSIQIFSSLGQLIYSTKYYGNKGRNINKIAIQTDEKVLVAKIQIDNKNYSTKLIRNEK